MDEKLFDTTKEIIKEVEKSSSYRFQEEKSHSIIFKNTRGDIRTIKYVKEKEKLKVIDDSATLKPLAFSNFL